MKNIGKIVAYTGGCAAVFYLTALGCNNILGNKEHISGHYHSVERADGAFSNTEYVCYHNGDYKEDTVRQFRMFMPMKSIIDGGVYGENDGLVDKIGFYSGLKTAPCVFYRDKDYKSHKREFDEADKLLAETKERFKEHFE